MLIKNPCFDERTKTSCPNRHSGCAMGCEKWDAYVRKRDQEYKRRFVESEAKHLSYETHAMRARIIQKKNFVGRPNKKSK